MKAALMTLGCKLNQADTMALAGILTEAGYQITPWNEKADLYLINTCTVTSSTDQQSRQAIRQAVRRNPSALIIVTGCYAQIDAQTIARLDGVDLVLGNQEKSALQEYLKGLSKDGLPRIFAGDISTRRTYQGVEGQMTCLRTRPLLKIQEGCNGNCTYCVIPRARGPERSLPPPQAKRQLSNLLAQGFQEIVLTGIRLGAYGQDLPEPAGLYGLVEDFLQTPGSWRLRLSSLEPQDISALVFIRAFQQWDRLCRHLHLPLQSGDDEILASMNRTYRAETYRTLVEDLAHQVPGISLGTDIIVGFPGETPAHFHRTRRFLQELPLSYFHVFPFSPRPGTPAATLAGMVPAPEKRERVSQLRSLSRKKSGEFRQSFLGKELQVIVLRKRDPRRGWWWALSDNYLPILVRDGTEEMIGRLLPVEVEAMEEGALLGRWRK
jgi:threonylcarbamoyladenosine tRNA methylthiotransferase MtaB